MAEEILVRESLSNNKLDLGRELLNELKKTNLKINVALWLYELDSQEWRLILSIQDYNTLDIKKIYQEIDQILRNMKSNNSEINIWNITITNEKHPFIFPIFELLKKSKIKLGNNKLSKTVINHVYYEEGYLYFVDL